MKTSTVNTGNDRFPRRILLTAITIVCIGLFLSALHTYFTLADLRGEYLSNRAQDIAESLFSQVRGPGRRNNPPVWEAEFAARIEGSEGQLLYLALLDSEGRILAESAGDPALPASVREAEPGYVGNLYLFDYRFNMGRGPRWETRAGAPGLRLRVGIQNSDADFLMQQGYLHLLIAALAIVLLIGVSFYLLRMLDRHLALTVREESERHFKTLGKMSATLAHEIRNPLGAMKGLTQVAQEELPEGHSTQSMMRTVVREAERLEVLISDLLTFARPRELKLEPVNLGDLIQSVAAILRPQAETAGIGLRIESLPSGVVIDSDGDALRQVLYNLILNSIEASGPEGAPGREVELRLERTGKKSQVELSICDRGSGLGEEDPEELFQPFRTTKTTGSGLGLPISRQLVERLGGRIQLSARPGGGACCKVRLG